MRSEETISRITRIFQREDGSEIRIVAENGNPCWLPPSIDYYVHRRESSDDAWTLCGDRPDPNWREMSVAEYLERGRSEVFQVLSHGEILQTLSAIGKPMSFVEGWAS